jgi:hypothetical protein
MGAGNFFGAIHGAREQCGAIFTDVRHASPRKLPRHSHELAFFALVLNGNYRERCGRHEGQYAPFTLMFRPAGVPHQDESALLVSAFTKSSFALSGKSGSLTAPPLWTLRVTTSAAARFCGLP